MKKYIFILLILFVSCCLFGCSNGSIQIKSESKFSEVMNSIGLSDNKPKVKKSSGVIIYKDESNTKPQDTNSSFGSTDIIFDMPIKIK